MKKIILLLTLCIQQLYGINSDSLHHERKWNVGISFSPDYSFRILKPLKSYDVRTNFFYKYCADSLNTIEKPTLSWTIGLPVTYHFNRLVSVKTGIYFSNKTFKSKGFVKANGVHLQWQIFKSERINKQDFVFIEVPFALQFTYRPEKFKKINLSPSIGVAICSNISEHYYSSRRWETDPLYQNPDLEESYTRLYVDRFELLYLGYTAGLKATYKLNNHFFIGLEPVFKFYGKEFVSASSYTMAWKEDKISRQIMGITEKPYSYGINLSLEF